MTSPVRSVAVRLSMDPSAYISGAARAATATTALDREVAKVGGTAGTSMERAASGMGSAEGAMGKLNQSAGALGFTLGSLAGVGSAVAVGMSVKWAGDYQAALTKLATTAGESQQNLGMVGKGMLDMAGQVGIGADELAKGMYTVESSGIHGADALNVLKAAAQGARQENADLSKVTDAVTTALHDYNLPASDAAKVTSQLVTAVSHGKTTFDELTGAMHSVTPLAAALGVPLADVAGVLSSMTASGESADQAAQNMADTLRHMQNPTATMTAELAQLGITSSDLSTQLSTKGLSGTLQGISEAIINKLDPATQKVLLPAFNQSKTAAQDLQIMLGNMPPTLAKVSQSLLDGTTSQGEYRKAAQALGGQAGVLGDNFLSLYKSSDGFSNVLKSGSPAAQVYTAALQKAVGTSAGLTVALQVTGEHAAATNAAIKDIAGSTSDAAGNIKGWDEVQGNFNQQLAQTEAHAKSLAIEAGQHLLPVLTGAFGWINSTGVPAIEHLGGAVGDAVHWFSGLPGPVKDVALALAGLKIAEMLGLFGRLGSAVSGVQGVFAGFRDEMRLQQGLAQMAGTEISNVGSAMATVQARASTVGKSIVGAFGGPVGASITGITLGVVALAAAFQQEKQDIAAATSQILAWKQAQDQGGQAGQDASKKLADYAKQIADLKDQINNESGASQASIEVLKQKQEALAGAEQKYKDLKASMTPVQELTGMVTQAQNNLNQALRDNPPNSQAVVAAQNQLWEAQHHLADETDRETQAQRTQTQVLADATDKLIANADAQAAAQRGQASLTQAIADYRNIAKPATADSLNLADAARQYAQQQADAAVAQAHANGITDTGTVSQTVYLKALQDAATQMGLSTPASISDLIKSLQAAMGAIGATQGAFQRLGAQSDEEKQKLKDLGFVLVTLPDGSVMVTADTNPAEAAIRDLVNYARQQSIQYRSDLVGPTPNVSGGGLMGRAATGGWIRGPGTGTSDSVPMWLSNGEFVVNASSAAQHKELLHAINTGGGVGGMAAGGWVGLSPDGTWPLPGVNVPVSYDEGPAKAAVHATWVAAAKAAAAAAAVGGPPTDPLGNVALGLQLATARGWGGMGEWTALYKLWQRESGWRNTAQNPTSTAYGIPQFLDGTWASVGAHKTSDAAAQINAGLTYIAQRFRDPIGAWAHETQFGWYHNGGVVQGPPGADVPAVLRVGETVRTAGQESAVQAVLRTRERSAPTPVIVVQAPPVPRAASRTTPYVGELHVHSEVDVDLLLREAEFRDRVGTFS